MLRRSEDFPSWELKWIGWNLRPFFIVILLLDAENIHQTTVWQWLIIIKSVQRRWRDVAQLSKLKIRNYPSWRCDPKWISEEICTFVHKPEIGLKLHPLSLRSTLLLLWFSPNTFFKSLGNSLPDKKAKNSSHPVNFHHITHAGYIRQRIFALITASRDEIAERGRKVKSISTSIYELA